MTRRADARRAKRAGKPFDPQANAAKHWLAKMRKRMDSICGNCAGRAMPTMRQVVITVNDETLEVVRLDNFHQNELVAIGVFEKAKAHVIDFFRQMREKQKEGGGVEIASADVLPLIPKPQPNGNNRIHKAA